MSLEGHWFSISNLNRTIGILLIDVTTLDKDTERKHKYLYKGTLNII